MEAASEILTTAEAADLLGCSPRTVQRLVGSDQLRPAFKGPGIRGGYFFHRDEVESYAETKEIP